MIVLAVDNNLVDLKMLCDSIRKIHPNAEIIHFIDPMLAFKYSTTNSVDSLYTAIIMKRLSGFKLEKMIRNDHQKVVVNFIADDNTYRVKAIQHFANSYIIKPVTKEKLIAAESEEW